MLWKCGVGVYLDCECMAGLRFNLKLKQAMRDITYGGQQILLMVIRPVLTRAETGEFSY